MGPLQAVGTPHWHKEGPQKGAALRICSLLVAHVPAWATQPAHPPVCANPLGLLWYSAIPLPLQLCPALVGFHSHLLEQLRARNQQRDGVRVLGEVWSPNSAATPGSVSLPPSPLCAWGSDTSAEEQFKATPGQPTNQPPGAPDL